MVLDVLLGKRVVRPIEDARRISSEGKTGHQQAVSGGTIPPLTCLSNLGSWEHGHQALWIIRADFGMQILLALLQGQGTRDPLPGKRRQILDL